MRLTSVPCGLTESIALAAGLLPTPLMDTLVALLLAKTVITATAIGIFDVLNNQPLTPFQIAARCESDPKATTKLVRALVACKYLKYRGHRLDLSAVSRRWLVGNRANSLRSAILHRKLDLRFMNFEEYVLRGKIPDFHANLTREDWQLYHEGQADQAAQLVEEVLKRIPLPSHARELLDLGGGHGLYSDAFCRRYPGLRARVIDLATRTGEPNTKRESLPLSPQVEFEVGDIRTRNFGSDCCDVILLANVLHHFDETTNHSLMRRAANALRPDGIAIVVDIVRPSSPEQTGQIEALLDLYFGAASGAGLWMVNDIQRWARNAGLSMLCCKATRWMPSCKMMVARKFGPVS